MKKFFFFTVFAFSAFSQASPLRHSLKMELFLDNKLIASPQVRVIDGQATHITHDLNGEKRFIDVVAKEQSDTKGKKSLRLEFALGTIGIDGAKNTLSSPRMIVSYNKKATISVGSNDGPTLSLSVLAKK